MSEEKKYSESELKDILKQRAAKRVDRLKEGLRRAQAKRAATLSPKTLEVDPMEGNYSMDVGGKSQFKIIQPRYAFHDLKRIVECSDVVSALIDVMVKNIEGFGFGLRFKGQDLDAKKPEYEAQRVKLTDFFTYVNEFESIVDISSRKRSDKEYFGCGAFIVVRAETKEIAAMYHTPMELIRGTTQDKDPVSVKYKIKRDGKLIEANYLRYFRRFVQIDLAGKIVQFFKEYGDPRNISKETGDVLSDNAPASACASELILDARYAGNYLYGIPRWMGAVMDIVGRRNAQQVNEDLFSSQGIPRLVVMVSGGTLTEESYGALEDLLLEAQGIANFNKVTLLEANSDSLGLDDRTNTARIDFKNLTDARQDDQMFTRYLDSTYKTARGIFRIPPLLLGLVDDYSLSNARSALAAAESQVFIPERILSDEKVNRMIVQIGLNIHDWSFYNKPLRLAGSDEAATMMKSFAKTGAFSINHALMQANEAFGLQMSPFDAPWANYPYDVVMELLKAGTLSGLDDIIDRTVVNNANKFNKFQQQNDINPDAGTPEDQISAKRSVMQSMAPTEATLYDTLDRIRKCISIIGLDKAEE